jgi:hypothetical protein
VDITGNGLNLIVRTDLANISCERSGWMLATELQEYSKCMKGNTNR